jgi:hypothetical protein
MIANSEMNDARDGRTVLLPRLSEEIERIEPMRERIDYIPRPIMALADEVNNAGYDSAFLSPESYEYKAIVAYLEANSASRTITAPQGERTRMVRAAEKIDALKAKKADKDKPWLPTDTAQLRTHLMTLLEDVSRTGPYQDLYREQNIPIKKQKPVSTGRVTVTRIMVIKNDILWAAYDAKRDEIIDEVESMPQSGSGSSTLSFGRAGNSLMPFIPRSKITFEAPHDSGLSEDSPAQLPVLDTRCGEALLMHGTSEDVCQIIASAGFDPVRNKGDTKNGTTKYGALGQGSYFGDSFAKVQTYISCPQCAAMRCNCTNADHQPQERVLILARCLLGNSTRARTHDSHRTQNAQMIKVGKHSVVGEAGLFGGGSALSAFGSNEFLVKQRSQLYPEFIVFWTRS